VAERVGPRLPGEGSALVARARALPAAAWVVLLVALGVVAAVVVAVVGHNSNRLDYEVDGSFVGGNPKAFTLDYEVTKSPLATAQCVLQAEDADHSVVGQLTDTVGPTDHNQRRTVRTVTIHTTDQAVTAEIASCHLVHTS
jgi:hypothetical protein